MVVSKNEPTQRGLKRSANSIRLDLAALAVAFGVFGGAIALHAQTTTDFIDPLEEVRQSLMEKAQSGESKPSESAPSISNTPVPRQRGAEFIEDPLYKAATEMRGAANNGAAQAEDAALSTWDRLRRVGGEIATKLGIPSSWLLTGVAGFLAAIALLLGWVLLGSKKRRADGDRSSVYSRRRSAERRRVVDRDAPMRRQNDARHDEEDFQDERIPPLRNHAAQAGFGGEAAQMAEPDFGDLGEEADAEKSTSVPTRDPSTWRRPKLDRLRESIRRDWRAAKTSPEEPDVFADMLAEEEASTRAEDTQLHDNALDALLQPDAVAHPSDLPLTQVASDWDDWDNGLQDGTDVFGDGTSQDKNALQDETPLATGDEALKRVRALRDALRAS